MCGVNNNTPTQIQRLHKYSDHQRVQHSLAHADNAETKSQRQQRTVCVTDKNHMKMELRIVSILGTIVVMLHISEARPYLIDTPEADSEQDEIMAAVERPKYMNTNDLSAFQDLDLYSMEESAEEDKINQKRLVPKSATVPNRRVKRQRNIRVLCIVRTGSTVIIIPCWKRV